MADEMKILGEGGRSRPAEKASAGMRQVRIFCGPRDNYDETAWDYIDPDGAIRATEVSRTPNVVTLEYPEERFLANQKAAEELAAARVRRAAPVGDASISHNTVDYGPPMTLEKHWDAAKGEYVSRFDG